MRTLKVIGLTVFFSLVGFVICLFISIMLRGVSVSVEPGHATGLSAVIGGIVEAFFSPLTWLVILVSSRLHSGWCEELRSLTVRFYLISDNRTSWELRSIM